MLLVLVNLPFALVGGVAVVYMMGGILDVGSMVGFVTLFGITTRNSIMMVSHWQHLHEVEGEPWDPELIFRGARREACPCADDGPGHGDSGFCPSPSVSANREAKSRGPCARDPGRARHIHGAQPAWLARVISPFWNAIAADANGSVTTNVVGSPPLL